MSTSLRGRNPNTNASASPKPHPSKPHPCNMPRAKMGSQNPSPDEKNPGKFQAIRQLADTASRDALNTHSKGPRPSCDVKNLAKYLHSFQPAKITSRDVFHLPRKRKLRCNFWNAALQKLHCNIGFSAVQMSFWPKAATPPEDIRTKKFGFGFLTPVCSQNVCSQFLCPLHPPLPNQQSDGFPLELLLRGPQTKLRTLSQNCEQTELWSNGRFWDRVFGKGVSEKEFQVVRALCSQVRSFLPPKQKRDTPRNFEMKRLFRNAFSQRSKRSEKEREERSLHRVPGPCSQVHPFSLAQLKRDTPRNFDMNREHTNEGVQQRTLLRRVLRSALETAFEKVLRRVLRRCLAVGFNGKKGSEKGS